MKKLYLQLLWVVIVGLSIYMIACSINSLNQPQTIYYKNFYSIAFYISVFVFGLYKLITTLISPKNYIVGDKIHDLVFVIISCFFATTGVLMLIFGPPWGRLLTITGIIFASYMGNYFFQRFRSK